MVTNSGQWIDPVKEQSISSYGTIQNNISDSRGSSGKPRLLTVSYSCLIIVQTWTVVGLTMGYSSPVLSDLEGNGNSSAPLDKIIYQDLFSVSLSKLHTAVAPPWQYTIPYKTKVWQKCVKCQFGESSLAKTLQY